METLPFASKAPLRSSWGCDESLDKNFKQEPVFRPDSRSNGHRSGSQTESPSPDQGSFLENNYEYMPAVLLNSLKRDKKPFTYTPGRLDLSEVLNEKLQKRMERKKKHLMERAMARKPDPPELPVFEAPKQVLVMPTYNSPLEMYSMENAIEALEVQAEIALADKSLSVPQRTQTLPRNYKYEAKDYEPKNVTQSKAFRVLQIITDTDEQPEEKDMDSHPQKQKYEMSFSGTGQNKVIPSKYFQTLQKMTGTDKHEPSENFLPKPKGFENNAGQFETRFSGLAQTKGIPSKYFKNLQRITGTEGEESSEPRQGNKVSDSQFQNETRFTGTGQSKVIPSRYFHNLQRITGTTEEESSNAVHKENRGTAGVQSAVRNEPRYSDRNGESNSMTTPQQLPSLSRNKTESAIPVLQRPAAFLPSSQKDAALKKSVRFISPTPFYNKSGSIRSFEGTDF